MTHLRSFYHHLHRSAILVILLLLAHLSTRAQYFVPGNDYCPGGPGVTFDTITYSPDKAMPFDRCFILKITLPSAQRITKFFITPIDKNGNPKARRRDWRVFMRSGYPDRESRKAAKEFIPFKAKKGSSIEDFKDNLIKRAFTGVSPSTKSKQITLRVPPLDPEREYRIYLAADDEEAANNYLTVGDLLVKSRGNFSNTLPGEALELEEQSKIEHNRSNLENSQRQPPWLFRSGYDEYVSYLTSFGLVFNQQRDRTMIYRFLFVSSDSTSTTLTDKNQADTLTNYIGVQDTMDPNTAIINFPFKDIKGRAIQAFANWQGKVYLLTNYASDQSVADLVLLGDLEINHNGLTRTLTVNKGLPGSKYIKLTESPLDHFSAIKKASETINAPPEILTESLNDSTLRFLLKQAALCPCEEKGIKDLTQKDDLMRTISLLYDNKGAIVAQVLQGLISLKEPFSDPVKPVQYTLRAANFGSSLKQINDLIEFARKEKTYYAVQEGRITVLLTSLETLRGGLLSQIDALDKLTKEQEQLRADFTQHFDLRKVQSIGMGSTTELNLLTETSFRIVPDFGFVALFKGNNLYDFQDFTPYLGFHVGFRPMDKNLPLRMIHYKSWRHRISFMSGLTLKPLKIDNQRDDFFGSNSLITGFGFRLNNYFRLTSGVVWFKGIDPNRLTNNKPVRFSPFVGLSLDLDLQTLFGGIKKLF